MGDRGIAVTRMKSETPWCPVYYISHAALCVCVHACACGHARVCTPFPAGDHHPPPTASGSLEKFVRGVLGGGGPGQGQEKVPLCAVCAQARLKALPK